MIVFQLVTIEVFNPSIKGRDDVFDLQTAKQSLNLCKLQETLSSLTWMGAWATKFFQCLTLEFKCPFPVVSEVS